MITVMKGDITRLDFDVIVNPVNTSVTPIGKVGIAIGKAGGYRLTDACQRLKTCQTGQAKMTLAYNLPCKAIIHVAGPIYSGSKKDQEYLEACYWNAMSIAYEYFKLNHLKHMTLAFRVFQQIPMAILETKLVQLRSTQSKMYLPNIPKRKLLM